jgi:hypothetical protein
MARFDQFHGEFHFHLSFDILSACLLIVARGITMSQPIRLGILFTFLLSCSLIAHGQQQFSGSYKMYIGERLFSEEKFVLTINTDGSRRSEAEVMIGSRKSKVITVSAGTRPGGK